MPRAMAGEAVTGTRGTGEDRSGVGTELLRQRGEYFISRFLDQFNYEDRLD